MAEKASVKEDRKIPLVRDYMTTEPRSLGSEQSLLDAVLIMRRDALRHILIVEDGRLIGLLTERDVASISPSHLLPLLPDEYNRLFEETKVSKVMIKKPIVTIPDAPLAEAVELLRSNRLGCLPVLEDGKPVGIITKGDMLRALYDLLRPAVTAVSVFLDPERDPAES